MESEGDTATMSSRKFTCVNCLVSFPTIKIQRDHYKTDWHRYNLKRKIAELPPVTAEEFRRCVLMVQQEDEARAKGKNGTYCSACKKSFASDKSFQNHLQSKKHLDMLKKTDNNGDIALPSSKIPKCQFLMVHQKGSSIATPTTTSVYNIEDSMIDSASSGTEELDSDEWDDVSLSPEDNPIYKNDCLFCSHHSDSHDDNVKHMTAVHSFFIPYAEYLTDADGLFEYLGYQISHFYQCIWCNEKKTFHSMQAVQSHMIDKGHIKIPIDADSAIELLDYYDFFGRNDENDDSDENDLSSLDDTILEDEDHWEVELFPGQPRVENSDSVTMVVPSGVICHRSILRYLKQNPGVTHLKPITRSKKTNLQELISYYRELGWNPAQKEMVKKKKKDIKFINFIRSKYEMKLNIKANKLQKHYRPQVDF